MPLAHIAMRAGKPDAYKQAIFDGLYRAMRETFDVPEDDQFMVVTEHDAASFRYGQSYLDISRSDDLVFIQITANNTRSTQQKKALFRLVVELLGKAPGLRAEDVFVNLIEVARENWSLGLGVAQYARTE
ncbi:tautomerase family protein [Sphingomonas morindae]|uniref:Tautomerase family protein n=1 Tax=Sphingomonas morindae TaxID=1541170 RepID=A0ABY4X3X7_9SPHN|nr:tautomerase family protein [Sphingomonas morindae]USI71566.1 tautomerase family protein [Sphingomonas morindae]